MWHHTGSQPQQNNEFCRPYDDLQILLRKHLLPFQLPQVQLPNTDPTPCINPHILEILLHYT